jgi:hypothetical protein
MADFTKLRAYLNRIVEVAEEDRSSVVSLGVVPAAQEAIREVDQLEQQNCPYCGYPGLTDNLGGELKNKKARSR